MSPCLRSYLMFNDETGPTVVAEYSASQIAGMRADGVSSTEVVDMVVDMSRQQVEEMKQVQARMDDTFALPKLSDEETNEVYAAVADMVADVAMRADNYTNPPSVADEESTVEERASFLSQAYDQHWDRSMEIDSWTRHSEDGSRSASEDDQGPLPFALESSTPAVTWTDYYAAVQDDEPDAWRRLTIGDVNYVIRKAMVELLRYHLFA